MKVAIIGAGAAGCFCAVQIKERRPDISVDVFESGPRAMMKLALTGGGRCNLTNTFDSAGDLSLIYPRGHRLMKRALMRFSQDDVCNWFEKKGVRLQVEDFGCVFPVSEDAMEIVGTLKTLLWKNGVAVHCNSKVGNISELSGYDAIVVCAGGGAIKMLDGTGIKTEPCVPSLFALQIRDGGLNGLSGITVENACLSLAGTPFKSDGILLLTDWGVSGPAVLKLSSYAARHLKGNGYKGDLRISWLGDLNENEVREAVTEHLAANSGKLLYGARMDRLSTRLWAHICSKAGLSDKSRCSEIGSKGINRLVNVLISDCYPIAGRNHYKEEFVTCGGVSLECVSSKTLECKTVPSLYFAGEVLDIDAITGGYNLQAAWSTAWIVAESICSR